MERPITDIKINKDMYRHRTKHIGTSYFDCKELGFVTIVTETLFHGDYILKGKEYCTGSDEAIAWLNGEHDDGA